MKIEFNDVNEIKKFAETYLGMTKRSSLGEAGGYGYKAGAVGCAPEKKAEALPAGFEPVTEADEVPFDEEKPHFTLDDIKTYANLAIKQGKREEVKEVLAKFGIERISMVPEDKLQAFGEALWKIGEVNDAQ